ncbi:GIY-YIG nuclease family protein [Virgibacillus sp. NKC19-3]|uniref:GIY-YIG nuclease family protein n=1 Tax=Virgibacillus saliphilus TaxID=2831674 RepID=UPI001C9A727F|nr:GIY-YIG nuclease family protein [Virgibacillus sp. NKC19-3]MBY7142562.1 GIY-YIG nuclease family protein [Virgibacillus sp. NKC19-3]
MKPIHYTVGKSDTRYAIKTWLPEDIEAVTIGKLGQFHFPKGYYVYVGSAKRNIRSRVDRHLQVDKKKRWHIDYLRPYLQIQAVQTYSGVEGECELFQRLVQENGGTMPVKGFGSSDCRCFSHLFYSDEEVMLN